ncbi:hypothetical protein GCWU000324_01916 [Kingella oralis ATCC 51147]|uniref:Uncharacterized protein n=1 Tax=Kingella oralis ATCC 51147 TaxID=629741 RepID=C4GIP5_9NEIS|nr:hypothetical protein GCWU000324_01916 [Kingella oralis ATCC 51147]
MPAFKRGALAINIRVINMTHADKGERLSKIFSGKMVGMEQILRDGLRDGVHGFQAA